MAERRFEEIGKTIGALVEEKNIAYGDSFSRSKEIIKILYPDGVKPEQYTDMLAITRVIDKLFRIATKKDAFGESPWRDICGYAILGIANDEPARKTNDELWEEQKKDTGHCNPYANIDADDYYTTHMTPPKETKGSDNANIDEEVDVFDRDVKDSEQEQKTTPSTIKFKPSRLGADTGI